MKASRDKHYKGNMKFPKFLVDSFVMDFYMQMDNNVIMFLKSLNELTYQSSVGGLPYKSQSM